MKLKGQGVVTMPTYTITVYERNGEKRLDESFEAKNDQEAKNIGQNRIEEHNYTEHPYRVVSPIAKLILFHS